MNDDITFCMNGWKECGLTRCERHPSNISDRSIPHSFAKLYRTEYCPLEMPKVADTVEVVRCKDCRFADAYYHCVYTNFWENAEDYCSRGEKKYG